jgi:hypothetical protein
VTAEHHNDTAVIALRGANGLDDTKEIARYEDVGKRLEERREASIVAGR